MSNYKKCPQCFKRVMSWHRFCSKCGNNLKFNTMVSDEWLKQWKNKLYKKLKIN